MFVDSAKVILQAGKGGDGVMSFRRERFIARGGPDGGDGGDGGDIIFIASSNEDTLADFRHNRLVKAGDGAPGGKRKRHGKRGADLELKLPVGTVIASADGKIIADLTEDGQRIVAAKGGKGGFGNAHFTSSIRQAPRVAEKGEPGEKLDATLELKMIADVGLIGLPNAGKSTLLSVISHARPEIADYPFTTLRPNLGVVDIGRTSLLIADIPGLIAGASQGKGLGDDFLRHVERTNVLIHLIDFYSDDVVKNYHIIQNELAEYKIDLSKRPQIVALTKVEGADKKALISKQEKLKKAAPRGTLILAISAQAHLGLDELMNAAAKKVEQTRRRAKNSPAELPVITLPEQTENWQIEKTADGFSVTGLKLERFAKRTRFGEEPAEQRLMDILRKNGVIKELEKSGIKEGQAISIGSPEIGRLTY